MTYQDTSLALLDSHFTKVTLDHCEEWIGKLEMEASKMLVLLPLLIPRREIMLT